MIIFIGSRLLLSINMDKSKLISAGKIVGVHGIKGALRVHSFLEDPENFKNYKKFYLGDMPVKIKLNFTKPNIAIIQINNLTDRNEAEKLVGKEIYLDKSEMPELKNDEYYYSDLIGLKVIDGQNNKEIGQILNVTNFGAGDLFEIKFNDGKPARFFPFSKNIFPKIDISAKFVEIVFPEEEFDN